MDLLQAMRQRHAVRAYGDQPIADHTLASLVQAIHDANDASGLNIQLIHDADDALSGCPTHYGRFKNVHAMLALIGSDSDSLDERVG